MPMPPIPTKCTRRLRPFTAVAPCGWSLGHPPQSTTPPASPTTCGWVYRSLGGLFKGSRPFLLAGIRVGPAAAAARRPGVPPRHRVVERYALASLREDERTPRRRGPPRRVGRGLVPAPPWPHAAPDRRSA